MANVGVEEDEFYITLLSNSSFQHFPKNRTSSFEVHLSKEIFLNNGNWRVALSDLIYPHTLYNIGENNNSIYVTYTHEIIDTQARTHHKQTKKLAVKIDPCFCRSLDGLKVLINECFEKKFECLLFRDELTSAQHFVVSSNIDKLITFFRSDNGGGGGEQPVDENISNTYDDLFKPEDVDGITKETSIEKKFDTQNDEIIIEADTFYNNLRDGEDQLGNVVVHSASIDIKLEGRLALQCGFTPNHNLYSCRNSPLPGSLNLGIPAEIFCYVNIIEPQLIANVCSQVLKIAKLIDRDTCFGETITREFINRSYVKLNRLRFQTIRVELRDSTGNLLNFSFGTSILQLHFKRDLAGVAKGSTF